MTCKMKLMGLKLPDGSTVDLNNPLDVEVAILMTDEDLLNDIKSAGITHLIFFPSTQIIANMNPFVECDKLDG